jgi:hypothetical protein
MSIAQPSTRARVDTSDAERTEPGSCATPQHPTGSPVGNALALAKLAADRRAGATALPVQRGIRREPVRREPVCRTPDPSESCPVQLDLFGDHADDGEAGR